MEILPTAPPKPDAAFEVVKKFCNHVRKAGNSVNRMKWWHSLDSRTQKEYLRVFKRVQDSGWATPALYAQAHKLRSNSYFKIRAAVLHVCLHRLEEGLRAFTQARGDEAARLWREMEDIAKYAVLVTEAKYANGGGTSKKKVRGGKGDTIPREREWVKDILVQLPARNRDSFIFAYVTGARPDELVKGGSIFQNKDGSYSAVIYGSKIDVSHGKGLEWRKLTFFEGDPMHGILNILHEKNKLYPKDPEAVIHVPRFGVRGGELKRPAKEFARVLEIAAKKAGFPKVTPYTLRHAFRSRLTPHVKRRYGAHLIDEVPEVRIDIAKAMGHQSVRSQQEYGGYGFLGEGGDCLIEHSGETIRSREMTPQADTQHDTGADLDMVSDVEPQEPDMDVDMNEDMEL